MCPKLLYSRILVATASLDYTAKLWDAALAGRCIQTLYGHTDKVTEVRWSHDSCYLATASVDRTVRVWEEPTKVGGHFECVQVFEAHKDGRATSVRFTPDSNRPIVVWVQLNGTSKVS